MWNNIKKQINNKIPPKEILRNALRKLEEEKERLFHLQMSLKGQNARLKEKVENLQKHIKKNTFDIKSAMSNNLKSKALELNNYGNTIKKERDQYRLTIEDIDKKSLQSSIQISQLELQKEKIATQIVFMTSSIKHHDFDVKNFLYDVLKNEVNIDLENDDLLSLEIDIALDKSKEQEDNTSKIKSFFDNQKKEKKQVEQSDTEKKEMINKFFSEKKDSVQQAKIDNFFKKK